MSYLIGFKSGITYIFSNNFRKVKTDSDYDFHLEKTLTLQNFIIHIKSDLNKIQNHYFYNIFLEKGLYQLTKKMTIISR